MTTAVSMAPVPGRGQDEDVLLRAEDDLQAFGHLHEDLGELRGPVVDDGLGRGGQDVLRDGRGPGREKVVLLDHESSLMDAWGIFTMPFKLIHSRNGLSIDLESTVQ